MESRPMFHLSFAIDDIDRARKFYGNILGCKEGREKHGRLDYDFFGHHLVAHLSPEDVIGDKGGKVSRNDSPLNHFGLIVVPEQFKEIEDRLIEAGTKFIREPQTSYKGELREHRTMVCSDGCGNTLEIKGMANVDRIYTTPKAAPYRFELQRPV